MLHKIEDESGQVWYAAGFFDGEGSVCIPRTKLSRSPRYREELEVRFGQTDPAPLYRLSSLWGRKVSGPNRRPGNQAPVWTWKLTGRRAVQFLQDIYPYLCTKHRQVWLALEYWAQCPRLTHRRPPTPQQEALRTGFRLALQYANRRGSDHVA